MLKWLYWYAGLFYLILAGVYMESGSRLWPIYDIGLAAIWFFLTVMMRRGEERRAHWENYDKQLKDLIDQLQARND